MSLTPKQELFVQEYLVDLNATQAAIRAGYSEQTAAQTGYENLRKPDIADAIAAAQADRLQRIGMTGDQVLRELAEIAQSDVNELVEHRVGSCRYCHGEGHRYQRTPGEMVRYEREWTALNEDRVRKGEPAEFFDPEGGIGYDPRKPPHPDCSECFGEGVGRPIFKDTAKASRAARRLYDGVKITKDGMEMKLRSRDHALGQLFKHLALGAPQKVEVTGKDGEAMAVELDAKQLARRIAFAIAKGAQAAKAPPKD